MQKNNSNSKLFSLSHHASQKYVTKYFPLFHTQAKAWACGHLSAFSQPKRKAYETKKKGKKHVNYFCAFFLDKKGLKISSNDAVWCAGSVVLLGQTWTSWVQYFKWILRIYCQKARNGWRVSFKVRNSKKLGRFLVLLPTNKSYSVHLSAWFKLYLNQGFDEKKKSSRV